MPDKYGSWAKGLAVADLGYALLGLGLIPSRLHYKLGPALGELATELARSDVHTWRFDAKPTAEQWRKLPPASVLSALVKDAASRTTQRFSLLPGSPLSTFDVWNEVRQSIPFDKAVAHMACAPSRRRVRLRWPLRVGFLSGEVGDHWMDDLKAADSWGGNVYETFVLSRRSPECDLLVCVDGPTDAQAEIARARAKIGDVRADVVAVFAPPGFASTEALKTLDATRCAVHADGVALLEATAVTPIQQLREFCKELSHNHPVDVALSRATGGRAMLMASRALLDASGLLLRTKNLATALEARDQAKLAVDVGKYGRWAEAAAPAPAPEPEPVGASTGGGAGQGIGYATAKPRRSTRRGPPPPPPPPRAEPQMPSPPLQHAKPPAPTRADMGRFLRRAAHTFPWQYESSDASELGSVMRQLADDDKKHSGARYLQAAFASEQKPDEPLKSALKRASRYVVNVFVGQPRKGFARGGTAFPDLPPPDDGRAHELDVVFWEPRLCPKPIVQKMDLPPLGSSGNCRFALRTRATTKSIHARISVLHRNRVLQTGTLTTTVGRKSEVKFELDAIPRRVLSGLDDRTQFSMAFVLNDVESTGQVHATANGVAQVFKYDDAAVDGVLTAISSAISDITNAPNNYQGIDAPGSQALLLELAARGADLRLYLVRNIIEGGTLITPEYVQVVSTKAGKFFPLEYVYDYAAPDQDATVCPNAAAALLAGDCAATCPRHANPAEMEKTICPFGFWGVRCVFERKLHDNKKATPAEPAGETAGLLRPLASVLVGATTKADAVAPTSVADMLTRIRKLDPAAAQVTEWAKWPDEVARAKPATLALVVHQEVDARNTPAIEIGPPPLLSSLFLRPKHVSAPGSTTPPIVLLIGCETGVASLGYEAFATKFQWNGAAQVVSTVAEVVGRQAAPMAAEILEAIDAVKTPTSFAVVMRDIRRKLLASGTPMVLGLIAEGDADWEVVGR